MKKNKILVSILLLTIVLLTQISCSYKDSIGRKFYLYLCNYTDKDCEVELINQKKIIKCEIPSKSCRTDEYKNFAREPEATVEVHLKKDGKEIEERKIYFPGGGLYCYSAYGGKCTQIVILSDESENFTMDFIDDWEAIPELKLIK